MCVFCIYDQFSILDTCSISRIRITSNGFCVKQRSMHLDDFLECLSLRNNTYLLLQVCEVVANEDISIFYWKPLIKISFFLFKLQSSKNYLSP